MALFHVFVFWFSVRLGSIIIGSLTMIQGVIWLFHFIHLSNNSIQFSEYLRVVTDDFGLHGPFFENIINDPEELIRISVFYFGCLIISSVLLIWGALQVQVSFIYPFIPFYIFYIVILALQLIVFIMTLKSNESGLGDLILYSNLGSFVLLFYLYTLGVVISFIEIVRELKKKLDRKPLLVKEAEKKIHTIHNNYNMKEAYFQYLKSFSK